MRLRDLEVRRLPNPAVDQILSCIGHLVSEDEVAALLYRRFAGFRGSALFATQGDATVGLCGWQQDEGFAFLGPIAVRPDKRKWGAGTHLVACAIDEMRASGIRVIESAFPKDDVPCQRLFTRARFRQVGVEERGGGQDWIRVERVLKKSK